ncbi:MAG: ABC transporter permease subunit [Candidatus Hydrogenedens sp.]|nr:ABC transporter permease subunit [Candidatus Hydrogenedens sp.]
MARLLRISGYALALGWLAFVVLPLFWVFLGALRSSREFAANPHGVPWLFLGGERGAQAWHDALRNFQAAWIESHFATYFVNSLLVTTCSLALILLLGSMAAYALSRFRFAGNRALYFYLIGGMMLPAQLVLVPLFFQTGAMSDWGSWLLGPLGLQVQFHDSLAGLVLIYTALSLPFTVMVLCGFFASLPGELREAALLEGCSETTIFWRVMLPLARPGLVSVAIFNVIGLWNEYLFALIFITSDEKRTLPLGLAKVSLQAQYKTDFGLMFTGLVIVILPTLLLYALLQRHLTKGVTVGALKG